MLADIIEINDEKIEIHIINLIGHDYFSIYALDSNANKVQGMEMRICKPFKMDLLEFALQEHTVAAVSFLRRQIETFGLNSSRKETIDPHLQQQNSIDDLRSAGCKAFLAGMHYRINPFTTINTLRSVEWHRGWMDEAKKHPGRFDFESDQFREYAYKRTARY